MKTITLGNLGRYFLGCRRGEDYVRTNEPNQVKFVRLYLVLKIILR